MKEIIIIDKPLLDLIIAQMFSNDALINLLDLFIGDELIIDQNDIAYLRLKYGNGDFLINPDTLIVYRRREVMYGSDNDERKRIGKLVFLKNNKLEIEPM